MWLCVGLSKNKYADDIDDYDNDDDNDDYEVLE